MGNKKKTAIILLCLISIMFALYNISHNVDSVEKKTSKFNQCVEMEKHIDHNSEILNHLSNSNERNALVTAHNLNVAKFNGMCNGEIR